MLHYKRVSKPRKPFVWKGKKPKLEMQVSLECRVHFRVLEKYLAKVYHIPEPDIRDITGARMSMVPEFIVNGLLPNTNNIWQQVVDIRNGRRVNNLSLLLNILCMDGFIQKGKYIVDMTPPPSPLDLYRAALSVDYDALCQECIHIKNENRADKEFMSQVKLLDSHAMSYKKELEKHEDSTARRDQ